MSLIDYIKAQRFNLKAIEKLPHYSTLVPLVDEIYTHSIKIIPLNTPPRYGRFLLLCHKSFLAAAILIGQAQPDDAAPITRRAIEVARVCLASKHNDENYEKWLSYEKRHERWKKREAGDKPPYLPPIQLDLPKDHTILNELMSEIGMLSDAYVHFTPEYYTSLNWKDDRKSEPPMVKLSYFISDQRVLEREFILLTGIHAKIIRLIDECLDNFLGNESSWRKLMTTLYEQGKLLSKKLDQ